MLEKNSISAWLGINTLPPSKTDKRFMDLIMKQVWKNTVRIKSFDKTSFKEEALKLREKDPRRIVAIYDERRRELRVAIHMTVARSLSREIGKHIPCQSLMTEIGLPLFENTTKVLGPKENGENWYIGTIDKLTDNLWIFPEKYDE